jgi:hypothetical protein
VELPVSLVTMPTARITMLNYENQRTKYVWTATVRYLRTVPERRRLKRTRITKRAVQEANALRVICPR